MATELLLSNELKVRIFVPLLTLREVLAREQLPASACTPSLLFAFCLPFTRSPARNTRGKRDQTASSKAGADLRGTGGVRELKQTNDFGATWCAASKRESIVQLVH